jgi:hypothetical protein
MAKPSSVQRRKLVSAASVSALLAACAPLQPKGNDRFLPLPTLDADTPLRVVYAHNPRFDRPVSGLIDAILVQAQALCTIHLGLGVQWTAVQEIPIDHLFSAITAQRWNQLRPLTYDFAGGRSRDILIIELERSLRLNRSPIAAQIAYAQPHLISTIAPNDSRSLAAALIDTQLVRFNQWKGLTGNDAQPLLNGSLYNEYMAWALAPRGQAWPFEVVITNQLLASVEYQSNSLHSALRGGVSNGLTCESPASRYGTVSTLSLFPFINQTSLTRQLRGDDDRFTADPVQAAATLLTHELGHQLLHLGHPFGNKSCVMNPPELLQFSNWVKGLDAARCPLGNEAENTAGVERFLATR